MQLVMHSTYNLWCDCVVDHFVCSKSLFYRDMASFPVDDVDDVHLEAGIEKRYEYSMLCHSVSAEVSFLVVFIRTGNSSMIKYSHPFDTRGTQCQPASGNRARPG